MSDKQWKGILVLVALIILFIIWQALTDPSMCGTGDGIHSQPCFQ